MPPKNWKEKRKFSRVSILQEIFFGGKKLRPLEDLSEEGMFIATPDPYLIGSIIDLEFKLGDDKKTIEVKAEVRHVRKRKGMGIKFISLKAQDRRQIKQYIKKLSA